MHAGTKANLAKLSPSQRTAIMMGGLPAALRSVPETCCDDNWKLLLGDVQLAHVLFLNILCLSSLKHWRDLVANAIFRVSGSQQADLHRVIYGLCRFASATNEIHGHGNHGLTRGIVAVDEAVTDFCGASVTVVAALSKRSA